MKQSWSVKNTRNRDRQREKERKRREGDEAKEKERKRRREGEELTEEAGRLLMERMKNEGIAVEVKTKKEDARGEA